MNDAQSEQSKYYDLSGTPAGWTPEEFRFAVLMLESLPRERLIDLFDVGKIVFTGGHDTLDEENFISVILSDTNKDELLHALRNLSQQKTPTRDA